MATSMDHPIYNIFDNTIFRTIQKLAAANNIIKNNKIKHKKKKKSLYNRPAIPPTSMPPSLPSPPCM